MSERGGGLVEQVIDAYQRGDFTAIRGLLSQDVIYSIPGQGSLSGKHHGIDAVIALLAQAKQNMLGKTYRQQVMAQSTGELHQATRMLVTAIVDGEQVEWTQNVVYLLRDHKLAGCWLFVDDEVAFDKYWSRPMRAGESAGAHKTNRGFSYSRA
jgi:uncharacterized protein